MQNDREDGTDRPQPARARRRVAWGGDRWRLSHPELFLNAVRNGLGRQLFGCWPSRVKPRNAALVEAATFFDLEIGAVHFSTEAWAYLNWVEHEAITQKLALVIEEGRFKN